MLESELKPYRYTVAAQIVEPTAKDYDEIDNIAKGFFVTSEAAPFEDGKPKMLFISAWMAHEGRNLNGDAFVAEELQQRVKQGLFAPPYAGMIDMDHDFQARGFWYKASYAFDEKAQRWGIITTGAVWAWRYPELVDFVRNEMIGRGFIYVSMSALAEIRETVTNYPDFLGQVTNILHNPIFFTSTILSVPPGDMDAKGFATEIAAELNAAAKEPKESTTIQTLIFPKTQWKSEAEASKWASGHGFKTDKNETTSTSYRYRQIEPDKFKKESFRTICLAGAPRDKPSSTDCKVKAVIGFLKGK